MARINNKTLSKFWQAFKTWPSIVASVFIAFGIFMLPLLGFNWLLIAIIILSFINLGLYIYFYMKS